jgi:SRSO17 transposase
VEPRRRARAFVLGLLADLPRKNCWTIAEHAGQATPDGMQHLLAGAVWDHDGIRDDVRALVVEHLGDPGAVLVVDETGDLEKGTATVGCSISTPAPPARSTTPKSRSTWRMPPRPGTG